MQNGHISLVSETMISGDTRQSLVFALEYTKNYLRMLNFCKNTILIYSKNSAKSSASNKQDTTIQNLAAVF